MKKQKSNTNQPGDPKNRPTLLLVDDDPINIKLLQAILNKEKFNILTAYNGEDAVAITEAKLPNALILDIMMPSMNGFEVTRLIKSNPKTENIPIILLTALDNSEQRKRGLECGAEEFLSKPIKAAELLSRIDSTLRLYSHRDDKDLHNETKTNYPEEITNKSHKEENQLPRLLVVEDNAYDIKLIQAFVINEFDVIFAKTGEEAIKIISNELAFNVIVVDVILPDINGFDLCKQIKTINETHNTPILFISSSNDYESKIRSIEVESDGLLNKPLDRRELLSRLRVLLKKKENFDYLKLDQKSLLQYSISDSLTGLYNRSYFKHILNQEIERSARQQQKFTLIIIDIDDFKTLNDTYGHLKGDFILQIIGKILKKNTRAMDTPVRYGNDEFAMILPNTELADTIAISERIRRSIENFVPPFKLTTKLPKITVSAGIAVYPTDAKDANNLIKTADNMLYCAKNGGKNQVKHTN